MRKSIALTVLLALGTFAAGSEYYVSPQGDDGNPGTKSRPFATIKRAAATMKPGDTCRIGAGVYHETVKPKNSGAPEKPISFTAESGAKVIVTGTDPVAGWRDHGNGTYKAAVQLDLGHENQVFLNGEPMIEARWPNRKSSDLLKADAAPIGGGSSVTAIGCERFPSDWSANDLKGAVVWVMADRKWSSWTSTVTGYDPKNKRLLVSKPYDGEKSWWVDQRHNPCRGGTFYITGALCLLDAPNEWRYDAANKVLYVRPPDGKAPADGAVTVKRRKLAFDLAGAAHVRVKGIDIVGASIDMTDAKHCLVQNMRARHIYHTRGGRTIMFIPRAKPGVCISGSHNVLRDCEIAYSAGSGVRLAGRSNAVINCHIHHTDYLGCYESSIYMNGIGHLVSHNSIHDTGRDCIKLGGAGHLIQYNDIYRPGRLCHDLGVIYSGGQDGGNTEIHHNWVHDNPGDRNNVGIYLDNYMKNYLVHHNVVWNTPRCIRLNGPTGYCIIANNTVATGIRNPWGPWKGQKVQFGSHVFNNLVGDRVAMNKEVFQAANLVGNPVAKRVRPDQGKPIIPNDAVDAGLSVLGLTDRFSVKAPDIGAFEKGLTPWKAGHDFENPPQPQYRRCASLLRNHVVNAAFEFARYHNDYTKQPLTPWRPTHGKQAKVEHHPGFNTPPANARLSVHGNSLRLCGNGDDGVEQDIAGLRPGSRYVFAAYVRMESAKDVVLEVRGHGAVPVSAHANNVKLAKGQTWRLVVVEFTTGARNSTATVTITKKGPGDAYIDDTGVIYWELRSPGNED